MGGHHFLERAATALLTALAGGLIACLLRLPTRLGYLLAGVAVGLHTPGFVADERSRQAVASVGVALLMFVLGVHGTLNDFRASARRAWIGGSARIAETAGLGPAASIATGWRVVANGMNRCR